MYLSSSPEFAQTARALELATRDHLKSLRDWNFHWLLACTFIVAIGLLMELPEIVHDMCEIYGRKSRELKYWLTPSVDRQEYPRRDWVKKWSALGWILIVLGVMGEGWFESQVSKYDSGLSNLTDTLVAEAQKESAHAEETAKGFEAKIAESTAHVKAAESQIAQAAATISTADARIAEAQKDAAESKKEAETEHLERVKLQAQLVWRRVSSSQCSTIRKALGTFSNTGINIEYVSGDTEGAQYAADFRACLGLLNGNSEYSSPGAVQPEGLWILADQNNELAERFRSALQAAHIEAQRQRSGGGVTLFVGPKPRPTFTPETNTK